jgi:hypothetical protein
MVRTEGDAKLAQTLMEDVYALFRGGHLDGHHVLDDEYQPGVGAE